MKEAPNQEKALYTVEETCKILSFGKTVIYEEIRSGRLRSVGRHKRRRIPASAIAEYVELLEAESA
ncbi:DNA-binding protein [Actinomadura harenae]|uniref:DNA-binding protein n=2 Tax=Actinomadura harenae TaxID=2483351 RepID=A0A3M2M6W3_9ACTN|nr:DNA-binding protein [Actinomadura harenae]